MQVNGSATNVALKAPTEVDGQDKTQSRLQSPAPTTSSPPRDTVDISSQAQALSAQTRTNDASMVVQEPARVEATQTTQNVDQEQQNTPAPPVAPEQATLAATEQTTETATTQQQAPDQADQTTPPTQTADTAPQSQTLQQATIVTQNIAPQNEPTPQKQAPEGPMAAVGGLSAGKGNIDLNV